MSRLMLILFFASQSLLIAQEQYVYRIRAEVPGEEPRILAGFCVKGIAGIVTSLHGVVASNNISAKSASNVVYKDLRIRQVDVKSDAAVLSSPELDKHSDVGFAIGDATSLSPGELVFVAGFPQGIDEHTRHLIVGYPPKKNLTHLIPPASSSDFATRKSPSVDLDVIEFDSTLVPGHSGGPVWNQRGEVVCIANGGIVGADISWAVPLGPLESINKWSGVQAQTDEMQRLSKLKDVGLFAYQFEGASHPSAQVVTQSSVGAATGLRDWILGDQRAFRRNIEQPRQLVKLYLHQLDDLSKTPGDQSIQLAVMRSGQYLASLSPTLGYSYQYISKLQDLKNHLDDLNEGLSLNSAERGLLSDQLDQIQKMLRNTIMLASVISNTEPSSINVKQDAFNQTVVNSETGILNANIDLLQTIAAKR
jgi:hypothetical protein